MALFLEALGNILSRTSSLLRNMSRDASEIEADANQLQLDAGTLLGIVSLVVAVLSTLVCVGQVIQQYVYTGSPIRLCDSIVYGGRNGLPGQGRRKWLWRQFRFRVIYDIPQISLVPLSPNVGMFVPYLIRPSPSFDWPPPEHKLMSQLTTFSDKNAVGEASWVAFCRVLRQACPGSVIVNKVTGDADRCPADMTNIPMPISLRDLAIFCLFLGMECSSASFVGGSIAMSGPVGTITSSQHPTLGSCVHYAPPQDGFRLARIGSRIDPAWILRACGRLRVGNVILVVGGAQHPHGPSGLRSPFEDHSAEDFFSSKTEKGFDAYTLPTTEIQTITLASLDYYWMSQMSVVPGFWATPFKGSPSLDLNTIWGASQVIFKVFSDIFWREDASPIGFAADMPMVLCGDNITSYPPYGVRYGQPGEMMGKDVVQLFASQHKLVDSIEFDCHIPKVLLRRESMTPAMHSRLDDHYNSSIEVMTLDVWLHVTARTPAIHAGRKQILPRVPSMIQDILSQHIVSFGAVAAGTRSDLDNGAKEMLAKLRALDLFGAELMYLMVAMLRTVKVGLCIALGNDSSELLEIIEKDVQAHLL